MAVVVPDGCGPGTLLNVQTPDGQALQVEVPHESAPGSTFHMQFYPLSEEAQAEMSALEAHPDDVPTGIEVVGEVVSSGTISDYGTDGCAYFVMKPACYHIGQFLQVLRSSGDYSDCCIHHIHLTALGPHYDVDVGGAMKCGVPEDDLHVPS